LADDGTLRWLIVFFDLLGRDRKCGLAADTLSRLHEKDATIRSGATRRMASKSDFHFNRNGWQMKFWSGGDEARNSSKPQA
jgi:hypothetical protein